MHKSRLSVVALSVAGAALLTGGAAASGATVDNQSFEADALADGDWMFGASEWSYDGLAGAFNPAESIFNYLPHGSQTAWTLNGGSLWQELQDTVQPDFEYTLEVLVGNRNDAAFGNYSIQLFAGDTLLAENVNDASPADGEWEQSILSYVVAPGDPSLGETFRIVLSNFGGGQVAFDDVRLTGFATPGPAALALLGVAGAWRGRRRRG